MSKVIHLWTDGSSVNNGEEKGLGGHGYALLYGDFEGVDITTQYCDDRFTLTGWDYHMETTNQREEMKACIQGLKRVKNHNVPITVYADSAYLINCMKERWYAKWRMNGWKNSKKEPVANQDLWEELLQVIEDGFLNVTFAKVKGHSKVYYNELCDTLAGQGLAKAREVRAAEIRDAA